MSSSHAHLALVGFMGSGKSAVGAMLAERLGMGFVDLDQRIEEDAGLSIDALFTQQGEVGFRAIERRVLRDVLNEATPAVIATGGGSFADSAMRQALRAHALSVYLLASIETLVDRLSQAEAIEHRPLLKGVDIEHTVRRLLAEREPAYQSADHVLRVDDLAIEEVCAEIESWLRRPSPAAASVEQAPGTPLNIKSQRGVYPVIVQPDFGPWAGEAMGQLFSGERVFVVSDESVWDRHGDALQNSLAPQGFQCIPHTFSPGEDSKNIDTIHRIWNHLAELGWNRSEPILTFGGGVCGDLGGFAASTYARGVPYVQCPTTTLSIADSSVGGKTGINLGQGKNLVGAFYPPSLVMVGLDLLATLDPKHYAAGLAEVVKIALSNDAELFAYLEKHQEALRSRQSKALHTVLARAVRQKAAVVQRDEYEEGERAVLNLGHSYGHAMEAASGYRLLHGEAVALGMLAELEYAEERGWGGALHDRSRTLLEALGLPTDWRSTPIDLQALGRDKKRSGANLRIPVLSEIGRHSFRNVPISDLRAFAQENGRVSDGAPG